MDSRIKNVMDEVFGNELVKLPVEDIRNWLKRNFTEIVHKLHETYKNGYETSIDENIKFKDPYTNIDREFYVTIRRTLYSAGDDSIDQILQYVPKDETILLGAKPFLKYYKTDQDIYGGLLRGITHELTHAVDPDRENHPQELDSGYDKYINSPREFPAFARMHIEYARHKMEDENFKNLVANYFKTGQKFPDPETQKFIDKLTNENKKIFLNLLKKELTSQG